jgi:hypothetical protein
MAASPRGGIKPEELATDEEVEQLETGIQPDVQPDQPAEETKPEEQPKEAPHEEAIPYNRFKEVNDQRLALERELAEHREFRTRLDERQRVINEANSRVNQQQAEQRRAAERPDPNIDPVGAELYDLKMARFQDQLAIEQLQRQAQEYQNTYNTGQEQRQFSDWVTNEANTYAASDTSYFPAAKFAADKRIAFWKAVAPNAPQGLAEKLVEGESVLIARMAQQFGGRFAPAVAQLAKEWGYLPAGAAKPNGGAPPRQTSPAQQRLQQVAAGQRVQGLGAVPAGGNANGASSYRNYSPNDIANMSEQEFMRAMSNPQSAADLKYALSRADGLDSEGSY